MVRIDNLPNAPGIGRVKVNISNIEGRICSDKWSDHDARVLCRSLAFKDGQAYKHFEEMSIFYSPFNGPYWSNNFNCKGNESKLDDCPHSGWGQVKTCESQHAAGVICFNKQGIYFKIGSGNFSRGTIQVAVDGVWGTICDDSWNAKGSKVLCRMMGYVGR